MAETKETKNVQQTETKTPAKVKMKALRNFSHHIGAGIPTIIGTEGEPLEVDDAHVEALEAGGFAEREGAKKPAQHEEPAKPAAGAKR